jgi:hypothetical protein
MVYGQIKPVRVRGKRIRGAGAVVEQRLRNVLKAPEGGRDTTRQGRDHGPHGRNHLGRPGSVPVLSSPESKGVTPDGFGRYTTLIRSLSAECGERPATGRGMTHRGNQPANSGPRTANSGPRSRPPARSARGADRVVLVNRCESPAARRAARNVEVGGSGGTGRRQRRPPAEGAGTDDGGEPQRRVSVEPAPTAAVCGAIGCRRTERLLKVCRSDGETRVLCFRHTLGWCL